MNKREKILAIALGAILVLFGGNALISRQRLASTRSQTQLQAALQTLEKSKLAIAHGKNATRRITEWQDLALPTDRDVAHSLYRAWLIQKIKEAGLSVDDINPNERTSVSPAYQSIGYEVKARGSLANITKFLYEFYSGTLLQQITKLQMTSTPGAPDLGIQLSVEALILPGATHTDSLPEGKSDRLKLASRDDYEKSIVGRDLFKTYTPPRPPREVVRTPRPTPPKFDEASQAYVTGIVQSGARMQAWITVRTTGEVLRLYEGDDLHVGELKGKIESIKPRLIVLKTDDDQSLRVQLGHSLRDEDKEQPKSDEAPAAADPASDT